MANKEKVSELLDMLYEMIDDARGSFNGTCKIDRDKALDILEEVKRTYPVEVDEAERLVQMRTDYLDKAQKEADIIRRQAEEQARHMIDEDEIQARVKAKATEILHETESKCNEMMQNAEDHAKTVTQQAEQRAAELKRVANAYCEDALTRAEEALTEAKAEVHACLERFQELSAEQKKKTAAAAKKVPYDAEKDT